MYHKIYALQSYRHADQPRTCCGLYTQFVLDNPVTVLFDLMTSGLMHTAGDRQTDKVTDEIDYSNKKHLKNVGPIRYCEPPHAHSPYVASGTVARRLRIDVHDIANDNDSA